MLARTWCGVARRQWQRQRRQHAESEWWCVLLGPSVTIAGNAEGLRWSTLPPPTGGREGEGEEGLLRGGDGKDYCVMMQ